MTLTRGHVVSLRRGGVGVVWSVTGGTAAIVPIWGANGPPRHRAEVRITALSDILACGISLRHPAVQSHLIHQAEISKLPGKGEPIGTVPPLLLAKIVTAVMREAATRAIEDRFVCLRPNGPPRAVVCI